MGAETTCVIETLCNIKIVHKAWRFRPNVAGEEVCGRWLLCSEDDLTLVVTGTHVPSNRTAMSQKWDSGTVSGTVFNCFGVVKRCELLKAWRVISYAYFELETVRTGSTDGPKHLWVTDCTIVMDCFNHRSLTGVKTFEKVLLNHSESFKLSGESRRQLGKGLGTSETR